MPNKRIRKWRSHRSLSQGKVAVGSPPPEAGRKPTKRQQGQLGGNKNACDNSEAEQRGIVQRVEQETKPREKKEEEAARDERRARRRVAEKERERESGGTRSILREESEEVMDGTSVMVQPSISRIPIPLLFIILAVADTPPRALSFFPSLSLIGTTQRPAVTKQRFRYKIHIRGAICILGTVKRRR